MYVPYVHVVCMNVSKSCIFIFAQSIYFYSGGGAFDEPPPTLLVLEFSLLLFTLATACLIFFIESDVALHPLLSVLISLSTVCTNKEMFFVANLST